MVGEPTYLLLRRNIGQHKVHRGVGALLFDFGHDGFTSAPVAADHHDARSHVSQSHGRSLAYARRSTRDQADLLAHAATVPFPLTSFHLSCLLRSLKTRGTPSASLENYSLIVVPKALAISLLPCSLYAFG